MAEPNIMGALRDSEFRAQVKQGLKDAANRGVAAFFGGPVDLASMVMRPFGYSTPDRDVVGGSEWIGKQMEQRGMVSEARNPIAEFLSAVAVPAGMARAAPGVFRAEQQAIQNAMAPRTLDPQTGAIVWHGTPHKFDKFDSSKIGTGEGAQAYGHGIYFAEARDVAEEYQKKLSSTGGAKNLAKQYGDIDNAIAEATKRIEHYKKMISDGGNGDIRRANSMLNIAIKNLKDLTAMKSGLPENTGSIYKVDLPDEQIAKMLDWDKPLSQQAPEVKAALEKAISALPKSLQDQTLKSIAGTLSDYERDWAPVTGGALYKQIGQARGAGQKVTPQGIQDASGTVSELLRQQGIPGIRYLDGGSRGTGQGTSNFVVFPGGEEYLQILERN